MIVVCWHRFGPYHHARARAAARHLDLLGLEVSTFDKVNNWAQIEQVVGFEKIELFPSSDVDQIPLQVFSEAVDRTLSKIDPAVIVIHGYSSRSALVILRWALLNRRPAVLMSESNAFDERRQGLKELFKARVVGLYSAGLAGGTLSADYLIKLGLARDRVVLGYDIVDNAHFAASKEIGVSAEVENLKPFFLACARFVEKKNLVRLLDAFAEYRRQVEGEAWRLVIVGDGPLRCELEARRAELGLDDQVSLPGYVQYDELPRWFGGASSFILPSTTEQWGLVVNEAMASGLPVLVSNRCGCAADLVHEGVNGFTFDPYDVQYMAQRMFRMAHCGVDLDGMGRASREIIADWGPERFAGGLQKAVGAAQRIGPKPLGLLDQVLLWALMRR